MSSDEAPFCTRHANTTRKVKTGTIIMTDQDYEALVVGGGPAGLSAALYMARYDRRVALFDTGHGRSTWHQVNYNYLGFPGGVPARELRARGLQQVAEYEQVTILAHKVDTMARDGEAFVARGQAGVWKGKTIVLCTGVVDHYPHFEGWQEYVGRGMFWCLTCDGYTCRGARVVVVGNSNHAALEALQLRRFTDQLTVLTDSHECLFNARIRERLSHAGIPIVCDKIADVEGRDGTFEAIHTRGGQRIELDQFFSEYGATPQSGLAAGLGVSLSPEGYIDVDNEQKTSVPGVYAAGDVTRLHSQQISTAVHEGGQAASAANYYLYPPELKEE